MLSERNYYHLLEVAQTATPNEIRQAYELAKRTYGVESLATYSLFGAEERQAVMAKVEGAYRVLSNPDRRREYDSWLAQSAHSSQNSMPGGGTTTGEAGSGGKPPPRDFPATQQTAPVAPSELAIPDLIYGRDLKRMREQLGVSLQSIANLTRINITYLQHLEADQHRKLPHQVFIRGYLLQYAQALKLDPDRLLAGYLSAMTNTPPNPQG